MDKVMYKCGVCGKPLKFKYDEYHPEILYPTAVCDNCKIQYALLIQIDENNIPYINMIVLNVIYTGAY